MLLEPTSEQILPPVYKVELLPSQEQESNLMQTLDQLPAPLGAIPEQSVRLASVLENKKLTSDAHF